MSSAEVRVGTHWAECWRVHLDCAIAHVERLKDDISACDIEIEELEAEKLRLLRLIDGYRSDSGVTSVQNEGTP